MEAPMRCETPNRHAKGSTSGSISASRGSIALVGVAYGAFYGVHYYTEREQ